ncbi:MAG TPA: hypothetical protein PLV82_04550, partial [bacterium]|nr:hypothetical protein [bacterium]
MRRENKGKIKSLFLGALAVLAVSLAMAHLIRGVLAEKSGASPESGTDSRLTTITKKLEELGHGSTAAGSWGDWGAAWNRIYSAATAPFIDALGGLYNGGGTNVLNCPAEKSDPACFPQVLGGVDDYNNNGLFPTDTYQQTWTACNSDNNYCGLGNVGGNIAEKLDPNTGLVWSSSLGNNNWFWANNCVYPNGLLGDDGQCNTNGEVACQCVKRSADSKTGCEGRAENGGGWRLPYQKELMQAYIDGSRGNLSSVSATYFSATTTSTATQNAWTTSLSNGSTNNYSYKISSFSVRC